MRFHKIQSDSEIFTRTAQVHLKDCTTVKNILDFLDRAKCSTDLLAGSISGSNGMVAFPEPELGMDLELHPPTSQKHILIIVIWEWI